MIIVYVGTDQRGFETFNELLRRTHFSPTVAWRRTLAAAVLEGAHQTGYKLLVLGADTQRPSQAGCDLLRSSARFDAVMALTREIDRTFPKRMREVGFDEGVVVPITTPKRLERTLRGLVAPNLFQRLRQWWERRFGARRNRPVPQEPEHLSIEGAVEASSAPAAVVDEAWFLNAEHVFAEDDEAEQGGVAEDAGGDALGGGGAVDGASEGPALGRPKRVTPTAKSLPLVATPERVDDPDVLNANDIADVAQWSRLDDDVADARPEPKRSAKKRGRTRHTVPGVPRPPAPRSMADTLKEGAPEAPPPAALLLEYDAAVRRSAPAVGELSGGEPASAGPGPEPAEALRRVGDGGDGRVEDRREVGITAEPDRREAPAREATALFGEVTASSGEAEVASDGAEATREESVAEAAVVPDEGAAAPDGAAPTREESVVEVASGEAGAGLGPVDVPADEADWSDSPARLEAVRAARRALEAVRGADRAHPKRSAVTEGRRGALGPLGLPRLTPDGRYSAAFVPPELPDLGASPEGSAGAESPAKPGPSAQGVAPKEDQAAAEASREETPPEPKPKPKPKVKAVPLTQDGRPWWEDA